MKQKEDTNKNFTESTSKECRRMHLSTEIIDFAHFFPVVLF